MKKRFLSIFLILSMLISILPGTVAFATGSPITGNITVETDGNGNVTKFSFTPSDANHCASGCKYRWAVYPNVYYTTAVEDDDENVNESTTKSYDVSRFSAANNDAAIKNAATLDVLGASIAYDSDSNLRVGQKYTVTLSTPITGETLIEAIDHETDGSVWAYYDSEGNPLTITATTAVPVIIKVWSDVHNEDVAELDSSAATPPATTGSITFKLKGGNVGGSEADFTKNDIAAGDKNQTALAGIAGVTPKRTGYKFLGWTLNGTETTAAAVSSAGDVTVTAGETTTVQACWAEKATLTAGDYGVSSYEKTYNGTNQTATITPKTGIPTPKTVYYGGETAGQKNASSTAYDITIDVDESDDYKAATGLKIGEMTIAKADYTLAGPGTINVAVGADIIGQEVTVSSASDAKALKGKVAADNITGKYTTVANATYTAGAKATEENHEYTGVAWEFTPDSTYDSTNYNDPASLLTGTTTVKTGALTGHAVTITTSDYKYTGSAQGPEPAVTDLGASDYTVTYTGIIADGSSTPYNSASKPTEAGSYKVTVELTSAKAATEKLTTTDSNIEITDLKKAEKSFTIGAKDVKPATTATIEKVYNKDTDVQKKTGADTYAALALSDLSIDGKVGSDDVSLSGTVAYGDANVGPSKAITQTGLSLTGDKAYNYNLVNNAALTGAITAKSVTAAWADSDKGKKVYGETGSIETTDLSFTGVEDGDDLGVSAVTSSGTAGNAAVKEGGYDISITKSNTNYNITEQPKYTVTKRPVTVVVAKVSTVPKYKGSNYNASDLATATVKDAGDSSPDNFPTAITAPTATVKSSDTLKNVASNYTIAFDALSDTDNFELKDEGSTKSISTGEIAKADAPTLAGPGQINVDYGASIVGQPADGVAGNMTGVNSESVSGTYKTAANATYDADAKADTEGQTYSGVKWVWTPDNETAYNTFIANYNDPTLEGTTTVKAGSLAGVKITEYAGGGTYGDVTDASITTSETVSKDVEYQKEGETSWSTTAPTGVGNHKVRYTLTTSGKKWDDDVPSGMTKESATVVTAPFNITAKTVTVDWAAASTNKSKKYGQTKTLSANDFTFDGATAAQLDELSITCTQAGSATAAVNTTGYDVTISTDNPNYTISGTPKFKVEKMGVTPTITTKTKTYGDDGSALVAKTNFTYEDEDGNTIAAADIGDVEFESEATVANKAASTTGYAVTVKTQPASYTVSNPTDKIVINKRPVIVTVAAKTTAPKYKGSDYAASELADVTVKDADGTDEFPSEISAPTATLSSTAEHLKNVASNYPISATLSDTDNFEIKADGSTSSINNGAIAKAAAPTLAEPGTFGVASGATVVGATKSGTLTAPDGTEIAGTYTTKVGGAGYDATTTVTDGASKTGVYWDWAPTAAAASAYAALLENYETPTTEGINATVKAEDLNAINVTNYTKGGGTYGDATITPASVTTNPATTVVTTYALAATSTNFDQNSAPTTAGTHKVQFEISGAKWVSQDSLPAGLERKSDTVLEANFVVNPKSVAISWKDGKGSKKYGQTTAVAADDITFGDLNAAQITELDPTIAVVSNADTTADASIGTYNVTVSSGSTNYTISGSPLTYSVGKMALTATINPANDTKTYGEDGSTQLAASNFTYVDEAGNPVASPVITGISFTSTEGTPATAAVSTEGYAISTTGTNDNYTVTTESKLKVKALPIKITATATGAQDYKNADFAHDELSTVTVTKKDGTALGVTAPELKYSYVKDGNTTSTVKNAGTYALTVDLADDVTNFTIEADADKGSANVTVNKVDPDKPVVEYSAKQGATDVSTRYSSQTVTTNGKSEQVTGTLEIENIQSPMGDASQTGLNWKFTPTGAFATNYNTIQGADAAINVGTKETKNVAIAGDTYTYDGNNHPATVPTPDGLTAADYDILYKLSTAGDETYSATEPKNAGTYTAKIQLKGLAVGDYDLAGTTTATITINPKTVNVTAADITKTYDKTTAATVGSLTTNDILPADTGVTLNTSGATTAFTTADKQENSTLTITGVTLDGNTDGNYVLAPITAKGTINAKDVTASWADTKGTKVYGEVVASIPDTDLTFSDGVTAADLGVTTVTSGGTTGNAVVDSYDITITKTNDNYNITSKPQYTVTKRPVIVTVTKKATAPTYKGSNYNASDLADVAVTDGDGTPATWGTGITTPPTATLSSTAQLKNAANNYSITATLSDTDNYEIVTADSTTSIADGTIGKATLTPPTTLNGTVARGAALSTAIFELNKADGVPGEEVAGTYTVTAPGTADEAGKTYENLAWKFTPSSATDVQNYNELTGNNASVTASNKDANPNVPDAAGVAPTEVGGNGSIKITRQTGDTDDTEIQYKLAAATEWSAPTKLSALTDDTITNLPVGQYVVRYAETDDKLPSANKEVEVPDLTTYKITASAAGANGTYKYSVDGGAEVTGDTPQVLAGKKVKITTTPNDGYEATVTVTKDGTTQTVRVTNGEFTMPDNDVTIKVTFAAKAVQPSGGGGGGSSSVNVTFDPASNGTITTGKTKVSVSYNNKIKSTAVPTVTASEGYTFIGWSEDGETVVDPTTVAIKKATTFTALYKEGDAEPTPTPTPEPEGDKAFHKHYITGYEDETFRPQNTISRAEVATIFALALTDYNADETYANPYEDVPDDEWYVNFVSYLASVGVVTGYEDGTFRPQNRITRQEFATMIARLGEVLSAGEMPFSDVSAENWGVDYIYTTYANGWVAGYEDGTFRPESQITRAEAVKIVNGYLGRNVDASSVANVEYNKFDDVETSHWAYYEIIEASNDHDYFVETAPEIWTK